MLMLFLPHPPSRFFPPPPPTGRSPSLPGFCLLFFGFLGWGILGLLLVWLFCRSCLLVASLFSFRSCYDQRSCGAVVWCFRRVMIQDFCLRPMLRLLSTTDHGLSCLRLPSRGILLHRMLSFVKRVLGSGKKDA